MKMLHNLPTIREQPSRDARAHLTRDHPAPPGCREGTGHRHPAWAPRGAGPSHTGESQGFWHSGGSWTRAVMCTDNLATCIWMVFCFVAFFFLFIPKEMGITDHLTCLLRNLYAGQEAAVRTRHGTMNWFKTGKGVYQGYILSLCLFNFYAEYITWNARLDESQPGIRIARRNNNHFSYADDTTLMIESREELKSLLMRVKEERKKLA